MINSKKHGFTLIELSIVLVIIGLIVGGVLVGRDLIHHAKLRKVISQVEQYKTAANTFRLKYNGLPGDLNNATIFFSGSANGDGDKLIEYAGAGNTGEYLRAWQQLGLAGLISGTYTGVAEVSEPKNEIGVNVPESPFSGAGFSLHNAPTGIATALSENVMIMGAERNTSFTINAAISGQDSYSIDLKADDSVASTGSIQTTRGFDKGSGCIDGSLDYLPTETDKNCRMHFFGF